jgi:hypothetical protein
MFEKMEETLCAGERPAGQYVKPGHTSEFIEQ